MKAQNINAIFWKKKINLRLYCFKKKSAKRNASVLSEKFIKFLHQLYKKNQEGKKRRGRNYIYQHLYNYGSSKP